MRKKAKNADNEDQTELQRTPRRQERAVGFRFFPAPQANAIAGTGAADSLKKARSPQSNFLRCLQSQGERTCVCRVRSPVPGLRITTRKKTGEPVPALRAPSRE